MMDLHYPTVRGFRPVSFSFLAMLMVCQVRANEAAAQSTWQIVDNAYQLIGKNNDEAIRLFTQVQRLGKDDALLRSKTLRGRALASLNQGMASQQQKDPAAASAAYNSALQDASDAIQAEPGNSDNYFVRGMANQLSENVDAADLDFSKAIEVNPANAEAYVSRASMRKKKGRYADTAADLSKAVELGQGTTVRNELAWLLATCPDRAVRNGALALEHATKACEATEFKNASYVDTLAAANAAAGRFDEAATWGYGAIKLAREQKLPVVMIAQMNGRVKLYEAKKPYIAGPIAGNRPAPAQGTSAVRPPAPVKPAGYPGSDGTDRPVPRTLLIHNTYLALKEGTPENIQKLVDSSYKYLKDQPGVVFFAAGPLADEIQRNISVRDFHVGLHMVFKTTHDFDIYMEAAATKQFYEENKAMFKSARSFDTHAAK